MAFFTEAEAASLRLARMSLHIVGNENEFEEQPELNIEHDDFLLAMLRDIAVDSVYRFADASGTRDQLQRIATRTVGFQEGAQALARDFCRLHAGAGTKAGAFFVFELAVDDENTKLYALIKYDYSEALEIVHAEGQPGLRRIVEAFVGSKSAIQKSAIVRVNTGVAEPQISTRDRMGTPRPALTDYFARYLEVTRDRSDEELTKDAKKVVLSALQDNREFLPAGSLASAVSNANRVLRESAEIDEEVIKRAVWVGAGQPEDEQIRASFDNSTDRLLRKTKLAGLRFAPSAAALPRSVRRKVRTQEGITIEYDTGLLGQSIREEPMEGGGTRFIVETESYSDDVSSERARR